ncbi:MAG: dTDP-4-dehydrorhamnose 3,5-epimerase [Candidatus Zambryskibacteria bacterium RIFCSPLOWO2_01_FULL_39_39]|uniref:dTDP-4-dehydrorhamnose 3,5-epimerase n=2 Tax=Patescibacteria group TaxID=1783273 RepID=A0A0G0F4I4_9BACT|nr:MAG: dTDP-4-deoxyrhamnose 3,5 epimerase [Candidatus Daviesbacteria bacterium GW2011_GWB1_36_5]KKQ77617.1 MAG: dTDP-4-deoxyrhamnose 3,5 epimerase [Parcubacteria group bacterium GW2011_GWA1_38_7]OHA87537.1 MAG: dTDP-4-dehydrorhamnose 3,5-epimerase [Candidatus Zambryskibacteria bacterium RIFCSPHIGHO2_01_FULL_39_63]OHA95065.1 MAG: dTDP-4-dehydrorhamnose 3,5-epimerase [Candidatus Zambryskibacteria bacterium RIFCSPHIGHO2_02_FULL_39_19]OHA98185.1 MAG: dTDP-4-dehydrorhamnose 3,5-epimerase [Candidatu
MSFNFKKLEIPGLLLIETAVFKDGRGFFMEKYKKSDFEPEHIPDFVQDNYSYSKLGVVRGLHYQLPPYAQGKLVSVIKGEILDVAVDMRKNSPFFGKWVGVELSDENHLSFYIPPGFAHGFAVLSEEAHFFYKCTSEYNTDAEKGVRWNDPALNINWQVLNPQLCDRDRRLPKLNEAETF